MKTIYAFLAVLLLTSLQLSAQTWQWTHPEPNGTGGSYENDAAHDVETDAAGNVYVLGEYNYSLYLSNTLIISGTVGSYLAKYNPDGVLQWYKLFYHISGDPGGGYPYIRATDFTINADGIFITGKYKGNNYSYYDCYHNIGYGTPIVYYMAGDTVEAGYQDFGFFITKMDTNGNTVWKKTGTVPAGQCINDRYTEPPRGGIAYSPMITSDKNNNVVSSFLLQGNNQNFLLGSDFISLESAYDKYIMTVKYDSNGLLQWSNYAKGNIYDINSMATDNAGNIFLYGSSYDGAIFGPFTYSSSYGYPSTFIAKLSASGTWQLVKELCNQSSNNVPTSTGLGNPELLATDEQGNVYALANGLNCSFLLLGTYNFCGDSHLLVKLNNNAELIWYKSVANYQSPLISVKYANNSLFINGGVQTTTNQISMFAPLNVQAAYNNTSSHTEYFIAKADTSGNFVWLNSFTSSTYGGYAAGMGIGVFNDNVYTAGTFNYNITTLGNLNSPYQTVYNSNQIFLGKLKDQYIRVGALSAKQVMPGCSITIPFTSTGLIFSAKNKFNAELSNASGDFTTPTVIGTVKSTGTGSINATIPATLVVGTSGYKIRIRSTDTLLTGFNYFAYADTGYTLSVACPGTASGLSSTNITGTAATVNWAAVGCASGYKVQYRVKGTTAWTTQNTNSSATSLAITGLVANTIYQWRISTKCKNNGVNSYSANSPLQQFTTAASVSAGSITSSSVNSAGISLFIQPNPAKASAVLVINGSVKNGVVTITDFVGKTVWKKEGIHAGQLVLPVQNFAAGIYLVKLVYGNETKMVKLVKE